MSNIHRMVQVSAVLLLVTLGPGGAFAATHVPIVNPGFDADPLPSPGADQPTITGWDTTAGGGDGIFRPTASDYPSGIPSGQNAAYANLSGNRVRQVLTTPLAPNTTYILKVAVGWNNNDEFHGYKVQLRVDGTTILAQDDSSKTPAQGSWVTSVVEYTSGATGVELGKPLEIWLLAPGIQANFDSVELFAYPANASVCADSLFIPFYLVDKNDPNGTNTLFAVRNVTDRTVVADAEYFTVGGTSQRKDSVTLAGQQTVTVSIRDVPGLAVDPDGFARGFVKIVTVGDPDRAPVLAGDFFQVDVGNNFATGERLVRQGDLCSDASIRSLDFGAGTRFAVFLTQPRGDDDGVHPPSFTVQVRDEAGDPDGPPQPVWTADHALELASADLTGLSFGSVRFDFTNSLGGAVYAEYSAQGRFSVGTTAQCDGARPCDATDCCPPGSPKALAAGLHYSGASFPDCEAAIDDAVRDLDSVHYRNACQAAHGGNLPDAVLGATVVDCQVNPPLSPGSVVVAVEVCCPLQ
jgi:hypothetical protein